jgi:uncharacterized protein
MLAGGILLLVLSLGGVLPLSAQQSVPELTGRVVDRADILDLSTERALTTILEAYEDSTTHQMAILTVPSLENESIEGYSVRVAETWALGTAERDNGVLMVVAPSEQQVRIEVGYGLESSLTDIETGRIIRNQMVPAFKEGHYDAGVTTGTLAVLERAVSASNLTGSTTESTDDQAQYMFAVFLFNVLILVPVVFAAFLVLLDNFFRPLLLVVLTCIVFLGGCGVQVGAVGLDSSIWSRIFAGIIAVGLFVWAYKYLRGRITGEEGFRERWKEFVFGALLGGVFRAGRPGLNLKSGDEKGGPPPDTSNLLGSSLPARTVQKLLEVSIFLCSIIIGFMLLATPVTAIPLLIAYIVFRSKKSSNRETLEETSSTRARPPEVGGATAGW